MPVYEFSCNACGARTSVFVRSVNSDVNGVCERCGSSDLHRLISKVAVIHTAFQPGEFTKQKLLDGVDYTNPKSMAQFFRNMGQEFQDGQNDYMDEIIGRLDAGDSVEQALDLNMHDHAGHDHGDSGGESESGGDAAE
jgi:putative FmdB family regulatory protein